MDDQIIDKKPTKDQEDQLENLDRQMLKIQKAGKKLCKKILKAGMEFNLELKLRNNHMQMWRQLVTLKEEKLSTLGIVSVWQR